MEMQRVTIIGLGLIGGSVGLALKKALKKAKVTGVELVGHDRDPETATGAKRRGAVDKTDWSLLRAVEKASLVIVATPVMAVKEVFSQIATVLPEGCVVTDTCSTKERVMEWAGEYLPSTVNFVGGHPMAGKELSGIAAADANLFVGCTYCLVVPPDAHKDAVVVVTNMVEMIGATSHFLDAREHDGLVAGISHLPALLSSALVSAVSKAPSWREMSVLAAGGFRDVSRLASSDPEMVNDVFCTNQDNILHWIDEYIKELGEFRRLVSECGEELRKQLGEAQQARDKWLAGPSEQPSYEMPGVAEQVAEQVAGLFMGERLARRALGTLREERKQTK